jgi:hypothetical protein
MSVVSVWYTRAAHMVDGDTGHKFIWSPHARPRPRGGRAAPAMRAPARPAGSAVRTSDVSSRARPAPAVLARDPVRAGVPRTG